MLVLPGEVLLEEFLRPMGISQDRLVLAIGMPESRINAICACAVSSARARASGCGCKEAMIWSWQSRP